MRRLLILLLFFYLESHAQFKGVTINLNSGTSSQIIADSIQELKRLGVRTVLFRFCEYQQNAESVYIEPVPTLSPSYSRIATAIDLAKKENMIVILMPIPLLQNPKNDSEWRGNLHPKNLAQWETSYAQMIEKYVRLAEQKHVEYFSLGSELSSMEYEVDFWEKLIEQSRREYHGKLFYSFNWDHLSTTNAWRKLDDLGITGYFQLTEKDQAPSVALAKTRWQEIHQQVHAWAALMNKNIIYTEIGYPSRKQGLYDPWNHTKDNPIFDAATQEIGFKGFMLSLGHTPWIHGTIFYEWLSKTPAQDTGYSPKGKPAESLWKTWFQSSVSPSL